MLQLLYSAFGLILESEIELPELLPASGLKPDVHIRLGNVPKHLPKANITGGVFEACPGDFIFRLDTVAGFRVSNGNEIIIEPNESALPEEITLFLLGSVIGALIHQRGSIPIHGSTILLNNGALIITGASASGKSTLAAGFMEKGFRILADDISVVSPNREGVFEVYPGVPYLKLWRDVTEHLKYPAQYEKVRPTLEKYKIPLKTTTHYYGAKIKHIVALSSKQSKVFSFEKKSGVEKFNLLKENTYRYQFIDGMGLTERHFRNLSLLANQVNFSKIERPASPLLLNELIKFLEKNVIHSQ